MIAYVSVALRGKQTIAYLRPFLSIMEGFAMSGVLQLNRIPCSVV